MANHRRTHVSVHKDIKDLVDFEFKMPNGKKIYSDNEIYKQGYLTLKVLNRTGEFLYGKHIWNKEKKKN